LALLVVLAVAACIAAILFFAFWRKAVAESESLRAKYGGIIDRDAEITKRDGQIKALGEKLARLDSDHTHKLAQLNEEYAKYKAVYDKLRAELAIVEESTELQSYGVYKPHYDFATSEEYKNRLEGIVVREKAAIKTGEATVCSTSWTVQGSKAQGERMTKQYSKLMLRAFNGEADAATLKVRWNNINVMEERIRRAHEAINKLGSVHHIAITPGYLELKLEELRLTFEYQDRLHAEKEEQRLIQQQIREEEKAQREIEAARQEAEEEERRSQKALDRARVEMEKATGERLSEFQTRIQQLEEDLRLAREQKERAISRAQLTKSGHVYVISNIGSFGDGMLKIGMTRRLEPGDRIRELGDASVPFGFDVHAMAYSENAPELEGRLHALLADKRVNLVNLRREYFYLSIEEFAEVARQHGIALQLTKMAEAREYRESMALRAQKEEATVPPTPETDALPDSLVPKHTPPSDDNPPA
jgi:multidrug efflux pump subunit AcrA (membrane-fusion protein)